MKKLIKLIKLIFNYCKNPKFWVDLPKNSLIYFKHSVAVIVIFSSFFILLVLVLFGEVYSSLGKIPVLGIPFRKVESLWGRTGNKHVKKLTNFLDNIRTFEVKRSYLIFLAFENLKVRKSRTIITIAGMSFGVGIIVLLLSLGYGIERLVINKVATLNELKVIDVSTGGNTTVRLDNEAIKKIKKFAKVEEAIPLVSIVGRITLNKATTDVLVYSTTNSYFKYSNSKVKKGKLFSNNSLSFVAGDEDVAGATTALVEGKFGQSITDNTLAYNIIPGEAALVWDKCSTSGEILGYTSRVEGGYEGKEYWGDDYYPFEDEARAGFDGKTGERLGKWVMGTVPIYDKNADDSLRPSFDEHGVQAWVNACIQKKYVQVEKEYLLREVLGEATESASLTNSLDASDSALLAFGSTVVGTDSAGIELIDLSTQDKAKKKATTALKFMGGSSGEAIASTGLLILLGIPESKAISTTFKTQLIVGKSQIPELAGKALTEEVEYKIIGIIDDAQNQYFYIPFSDSKNAGITNFSQAKIVLADKRDMPKTRKQVEALGFRTASTTDTVAQIEMLFANLRFILGLLGMVALGVASLGMFNTLTVSLLERTREIGGMKTIGMVTDEVQELFLSEAMIMGLSGGIGGLIMGYLVGKALSTLVSIFAITRGAGFVNLTYVPPFLIFFIILSSFIVGVITGLYPAMRAKKISALNALRYE